MWVEFKCPICSQELEDDGDLANFLVCKNNSHGLLRFYTGDGCFFTTDHKVAEALLLKGRKVHVSDPERFRPVRIIASSANHYYPMFPFKPAIAPGP